MTKKRYKKLSAGLEQVNFKESLAPIGDIHIYDSVQPMDRKRTKCISELKGYVCGHNSNKENISDYILLRVYDKKDINEEYLRFISRDREAFKIVDSTTRYGLDGLARVDELTELEEINQTEFYIVKYSFKREAKLLNSKLTDLLSTKERLLLCKDICFSFDKLHKEKIFHRLLNHNCIYLCKFNDGWAPYITKFDFSKLNINPDYTVLNNAKDAIKDLKNEEILNSYISPEWKNTDETVNYQLVDIYSIGVLCINILNGSFE